MLDFYPEMDFSSVSKPKEQRSPTRINRDLFGDVSFPDRDPSRIPGLPDKTSSVVEETPGIAVDETSIVTPEQVAYMVDASLKTGIVIGGALTLAAGLVYILIVK